MLVFFFKRIIFHIIYLYSTPFCPFSDKRLDLFPGFIKLLLHLNERERDAEQGDMSNSIKNCCFNDFETCDSIRIVRRQNFDSNE